MISTTIEHNICIYRCIWTERYGGLAMLIALHPTDFLIRWDDPNPNGPPTDEGVDRARPGDQVLLL